jgi:hypothetical protein
MKILIMAILMASPFSLLFAQQSDMNKNTLSSKETQNVVILAPVQAIPVSAYQPTVDKKTVSSAESINEKIVEIPAKSALPASTYKSVPKSADGQIKSATIELLPIDAQRQPFTNDNK